MKKIDKVTVKGVSKYFGSRPVVNNISFEANPGFPVVIYGPSGCGKTTLLRLVAGLERPDDGEVLLTGILASSSSFVLEPHKRNTGFVFQSPALWPHLTVAQNILYGLSKVSPDEAEKRLKYLVSRTSLDGLEKCYPGTLSGGEARRVALARALAPMPGILIMDEPLSNLNDELKQSLLELILEEHKKATSCLIYVTHSMNEASYLSKNTMRMKDGKLE